MRFPKFLAGVLLAFLFTSPALAVPTVDVAELVSEPGEPLETWILRVAPVLERYTADTGWEACGIVGQDPTTERFGVRVVSSKGAMTCEMKRSNMPAGMVPLRLTFHSHPQKHSVFPTATDVAFYGENPLTSGRAIVRNRPERIGDHTFSAGDYLAGPGYVITKGRVFYQEGKGTERDLGALPVALAAN